MNSPDHLQGQQRMAEEDARQSGVAQWNARLLLRRRQDHPLMVALDDGDRDGLAGRGDDKLIGHVHRHEGRDIELFGAALANEAASWPVDGKEIAVTLPKGVVDLIEYRLQRAVAGMAEIDAQRIERIAEETRHGQEPDRAAVRRQARLMHVALDLAA